VASPCGHGREGDSGVKKVGYMSMAKIVESAFQSGATASRLEVSVE
jgi:hypothetical protein